MLMILASLLLLLILVMAFFDVQVLTSNQATERAPDLAFIQQIAAIKSGEQLLLSPIFYATYLPIIYH
jgi:hypothetical protein